MTVLLEYARTDYENSIERTAIVKAICDYFFTHSSCKVVFNLWGKSGVGKSYICKTLYNSNLIIPREYKVLVDFNQIVNNSLPGIIQAIINKLGYGRFYKTLRQLDIYFRSIDASKTDCLAKCIDLFVQELNEYADNQHNIILIFDTFEALCSNSVRKGFKQILEQSNSHVGFIVSGTKIADFPTSTAYHVSGFDETEIKDYLISQNPKMKAVFKKHDTLLGSQIRRYTDDGNPILCSLVSGLLMHCKDLRQQIDYLVSIGEPTYEHLISWIKYLDKNIQMALRITAFFNDRMTVRLFSAISGIDESDSRKCLQEMTHFTFVKSFSEEFDPEPQIVLHDVAAKLIREYCSFSKDELYQFTQKAILIYDRMIEEDKKISDAFRLGQSFRVEKIMCTVRNGAYEEALISFDNEILDGIDVFDYSFVSQLTGEVERFLEEIPSVLEEDIEKKNKWRYLLQVANAEVELSKYHPERVIDIYNKLKKDPLYKVELYGALADNFFARALINPCTLDCDIKPANAIKVLSCSISEIANSGFDRRLVKSFYWLGNAYVRIGQNDYAQTAYDYALSKSQTAIQRVTILLDVSKMIRLQQDLEKALIPLQQCDHLIEGINKNKGKYFYYTGNIFRDFGDIAKAIHFYDKALDELSGGDDNFTFCELNLDYAWLQYVRDDTEEIDVEKVWRYLNIGWEYAEKYHFGSEYSEYHHIIYEILNYLGKYDDAYFHLDQAIDFAYQYSNIYMILDCLNHRVQRYYREGLFDQVPDVIQEMEKIEKRGCKIRVFRGRAKLVQADIYYDSCNYESALKEYFEGFVIVALYGNSHTNVELFDDLYNGKGNLNLSRKEKIKKCLCSLSEEKANIYRKKYRNAWSRKKLNQSYKYFLECLH